MAGCEGENEKTPRDQSKSQAQARIAGLSGREVEVLALIVCGGANKTIARKLGISHRTVEIHRANMMRKLGARSIADAVRIALQANIDDGS